MEIPMLRTFFMWCTILNMGLLLVSALILAVAGDFVCRLHGKWFPMPRETFNAALYAMLGFFKIVVIVFNAVPWAVLAMMG